jgi:hypothetical protein
MFRQRFGGPGETISREALEGSLLLFDPGATFYATWPKTQVFSAIGPSQRVKENAMTRMLARVALLIFAATMSICAFAGSKSESVTLLHDVQLNGTTIPAGEYTVKYDANGSTCLVKVMKGNKTVATANGEIKQLSGKPEHNQVVLQNDTGNLPTVSEMDFSNTTTAITFGSNMSTASGK